MGGNSQPINSKSNINNTNAIQSQNSVSSQAGAEGLLQARKVSTNSNLMTEAKARAGVMKILNTMDENKIERTMQQYRVGADQLDECFFYTLPDHIRDQFVHENGEITPRPGRTDKYDDYVKDTYNTWQEKLNLLNTPIITRLEAAMGVEFTKDQKLEILNSLN